MADKEIEKRHQALTTSLAESKVRIRRYTLDPRLRLSQAAKGERSDQNDRSDPAAEQLRIKADNAWQKWLQVRDKFFALPPTPTSQDLNGVERDLLELDREVDLIQRDLISEKSFNAGIRTVMWMVLVLLLFILLYLVTHGVSGFDFSTFEPWPEWGPLKYGEVAFWSSFGVLCYLLFLATYYLARRDFD